MLKVLENGQVLKQEKGDTYELWVAIGNEIEAQVTVDKTEAKVNEPINVSLIWTKVNLETGVWEADSSNQDTFNLIAGDQNFTVPVNPGTQEVSFATAGIYIIGVRNPNRDSRDVTVTVTQ